MTSSSAVFKTRMCLAAIVAFVGFCGRAVPAYAQSGKPVLRTKISVELLTGSTAGGILAQKWGREFQKLGYTVRVRRGNKLSEPKISEKQVGSTRWITIVGLLNSRGQIAFHDRTFASTSESEKIGKWLKDLESFGAQGNPDGQPLWGLNQSQFDAIYKELTGETKFSVKGLNIRKAVARLQLNSKYPVRFTPASLAWLASEFPDGAKVQQEFKGFSKATALAIMLNNLGLGVRPRRQPDKSIELTIDPLKDYTEVWPVGWELKQAKTQTAPGLFQFIDVDLSDIPVLDVMDVISEQTQVPIRFDHYRIAGDGLNLDEARFSYPSRKSTPIRIVSSAASRNRMAARLVIDELGKPFIWVTTGRAERARLTKQNSRTNK